MASIKKTKKPARSPLEEERIVSEIRRKTLKLESLKDKHKDKDIYVIGSGPSMSYIDPTFFQSKIVVCVNHTICHVKNGPNLEPASIYLVTKEPCKFMNHMLKKRNGIMVTCERHSGVPKNKPNTILHPKQTAIFQSGNMSSLKNTKQNTHLIRTSSTITTAIHFAAFAGAKNIILVGHDCGTIDGHVHVEEYRKTTAVIKENRYGKWMGQKKVEQTTLSVKNALKTFWDVNVYSINPFINLGLEGHTYQPFQ